MQAGQPDPAEVAWQAVLPAPASDPLHGDRLTVLIGGNQPNELAGSLWHVQLLATAIVPDASTLGTPVVSIAPITGPATLASPFLVNAGESGSLLVNLGDSCVAGECDAVGFTASTFNRDGAAATTQLDVTWRFEARAWGLPPVGAPADFFLQVQ